MHTHQHTSQIIRAVLTAGTLVLIGHLAVPAQASLLVVAWGREGFGRQAAFWHVIDR